MGFISSMNIIIINQCCLNYTLREFNNNIISSCFTRIVRDLELFTYYRNLYFHDLHFSDKRRLTV